MADEMAAFDRTVRLYRELQEEVAAAARRRYPPGSRWAYQGRVVVVIESCAEPDFVGVRVAVPYRPMIDAAGDGCVIVDILTLRPLPGDFPC